VTVNQPHPRVPQEELVPFLYREPEQLSFHYRNTTPSATYGLL
jgi:hypothetical protein